MSNVELLYGRWQWSKVGRYGDYVEKLREETRRKEEKELEAFKKQLAKLRKEIIKLGEVPNKETQILSTMNYFVKFINVVTNFYDTRKFKTTNPDYAEKIEELYECFKEIIRRDSENVDYQNLTKPGETVTINNLFVGVVRVIQEDEDISKIPPERIRVVYDKRYEVRVELHSISDWMNNRVINCDNYLVSLKQETFSKNILTMKENLLKAIDTIFN